MNFLGEAFKRLNTLQEDTFDITDTDIAELEDTVVGTDEDETIDIIDDEVDTFEELQPSYVGKVILDCNVCHSLVYKDKADVVLSDDGEDANLSDECPYCMSTDGFKIVGEVAPFAEKAEEEIEVKVDDAPAEVETDEEAEVEENSDLEEGYSRIRRKALRESARNKINNRSKSKRFVESKKSKSLKENYDVGLFYSAEDKPGRIDPSFLRDLGGAIEETLTYDVRDNIHITGGQKLNKNTYEYVISGDFSKHWPEEEVKKQMDWFFDGCSFYVDNIKYTPTEVTLTLINDPDRFGWKDWGYEDDDEFDESLNEATNRIPLAKYDPRFGDEYTIDSSGNVYKDGKLRKWRPGSSQWDGKLDAVTKKGMKTTIAQQKLRDFVVDNPRLFEGLNEAYVISTWGQIDDDPFELAKEYNLTVKKIGSKSDEVTYKFIGKKEDLERAKNDGYFYSDEEKILEEDFQDVSITTEDQHMEMTTDEDGKVTVTTEPVHPEDEASEEEMIVPVDDELEAEIEAGPEEEEALVDGEEFEDEFVADEDGDVEVDLEDIDEESLDDVTESYLREVYENVDSFKTTGVTQNGNTLKVEGVINFKSGKERKTSFLFEAKQITKKGKVKLTGMNESITRGKKPYTITGTVTNKRLVVESFNYNYRQKDENGNSVRLYNTCKRSK